MFEIDTGAEGAEGPWLSWSARGTLDGEIPAKSFFLNDGGEKKLVDAFSRGVVMDVHNMKTGWIENDGTPGQAPDKQWNASIARMAPQPGDGYRKGFSIRCAISKDQAATWEQAGVAAWNAFTGLVPALREKGNTTQLPVVKMTGTKVEQFKRGSTVTPVLEVVKWVDRPAILEAGIDTGDSAAAPAKAAPEPALAEDEEF